MSRKTPARETPAPAEPPPEAALREVFDERPQDGGSYSKTEDGRWHRREPTTAPS